MIKVELIKSIAPKQEVSRAKILENKTSFKDVLTRETNKISNNNTNKTNKAIEKTNAKEKDKSLTKTKTKTKISKANDKKIKENNQLANNKENKKTKVGDKKKKTKANVENQQLAFIDIKHITTKGKVNKKNDGKKIEVLSVETKNKNIKLKRKINNNIKTKISANVTDIKEKDSKNVMSLKDAPATNKEKTDNSEKDKHAKLIKLSKDIENLKEHKNNKVKQEFISIVEAKQKKTSGIKKGTKTNHIVGTNSIKDGKKENKNIKTKHAAKDTKLYAQTEKKHNQKHSLILNKEKLPKSKSLIVENHTTQKVNEKKTENTKIKNTDTKDLEKPNGRNNVEILRDSNNKDTKTALNNTTKLDNSNNQVNTIQNSESRKNIEIRPEKIKKTSSVNVKNKKDKKILKVDTKKQHTVNTEKDLMQKVQKKDINSQDNHQQNLTLHSKENIELGKKLKSRQKITFTNEIKDKAINHENNVQQPNNTHIYTTNTQTNSTNQIQQVQTNQTNLHPPLDKVIKEIDKISNLKPPVTKSITLKLNPPNLGNLHLKVSLDVQKNLTASIAVHDKNTYKTIVNHIDSLKEYLVTNGIKVQNIDVHNSFNENFMNQFSNGSGNFQQQGQTNGNQTSSGFNYNNFDGETAQKESRIITQSRHVSGIDINA